MGLLVFYIIYPTFILNMRIFNKIPLVPCNSVTDLDNVMLIQFPRSSFFKWDFAYNGNYGHAGNTIREKRKGKGLFLGLSVSTTTSLFPHV